jgi:magnesium-transporting ATPase (P-type)|tara:strand:+ start:858 stop:1082 length:225 start_codon:yes stop_codon:yes gene_type:complete
MSILGIAFFTAIGYFIIVYKLLGRKKLVKTQLLWDILFTIGLPILFIGTFSGLATAVLAGVMFSVFTSLLPKES